MSQKNEVGMSSKGADDLLHDLTRLIDQGRSQAAAAVNSALTITYWQVGRRISDEILGGGRADYGKKVVIQVAEKLVANYGKSFEAKNVRRMIQFAELFPDLGIVVPLARQLSWSHFLTLIPLKSIDARLFYAEQASESRWSKRELRNQIERKAFERAEIADHKMKLSESSNFGGSFKDPYFLDFLGLKDGYLENELESALIKELAPSEYLTKVRFQIASGERYIRSLVSEQDLQDNLTANEIPAGFDQADHSSYNDFLTERRQLMPQKIKFHYEQL